MTNPGNKNILPQPGYPLLYGANKIVEGYNFAVEAEEESQVSLLFYKKKVRFDITFSIIFTIVS